MEKVISHDLNEKYSYQDICDGLSKKHDYVMWSRTLQTHKRYGFPIHGTVDGYSKKIFWMSVGSTYNKPEVMASHFVNAVKELKCLPAVLRTDNEKENGIMGSI